MRHCSGAKNFSKFFLRALILSTNSLHMTQAPPLEIRKLRAEMEMKFLSLTAVAKKARIKLYRASEVLLGKRNDPVTLAKLAKAIHNAPQIDEEVTA